MNKLLGYRIKLFRTKKKLSREYLSKKLGISIHTLIKYEQGQREPNIETLIKICDLLQLNLDTLTCSEFFGYEILCRAKQMTLKKYAHMDEIDPYILLDKYVDHDVLLSCDNRITNDLPLDCTKRVLDCINDFSREDFSKVYNDLVSTDIYDLDCSIKDHCHGLHMISELSDGCLDDDQLPSMEYLYSMSNYDMSSVLNSYNRAHNLNSLNSSYSCKEHLEYLIKYKIKDFDFSTLETNDFNSILSNTLDFIEYQVYKIKNKKNDI